MLEFPPKSVTFFCEGFLHHCQGNFLASPKAWKLEKFLTYTSGSATVFNLFGSESPSLSLCPFIRLELFTDLPSGKKLAPNKSAMTDC